MYKILFFETFDWEEQESIWGAIDRPSPYEDETHKGWMLPDGWQEHMEKRGIAFEEIEVQESLE